MDRENTDCFVFYCIDIIYIHPCSRLQRSGDRV